MRRRPVITIDGPVGSGKSTVGRMLAERHGYVCVDSGLFYRAVAWALLRQAGDPDSAADAVAAAQSLRLTLEPNAGGPHAARILHNHDDITDELYGAEIERIVSSVSQIPEVRRALLDRQRDAIGRGGVVALGRDIGTVVWPQADLKIYLDASLETRVQRKWRQRQDAGETISPQEVRALLETRDRIDSQRATAPLQAAADAIKLDTDGLSTEQVVRRIEALMRRRSLVEAT